MHGALRVREDHGLARDHVPGDPVDEGFPFAAIHLGVLGSRPMGQGYGPDLSAAVGPRRDVSLASARSPDIGVPVPIEPKPARREPVPA